MSTTKHQINWCTPEDTSVDALQDGTACDLTWTNLLVDYTLSELTTARTRHDNHTHARTHTHTCNLMCRNDRTLASSWS
jgi:hypothetical protein